MMMMMGDSLAMGVDSGPISPMNYKRAVLRSAPREFAVEVLLPVKHGNNWFYGLKVCPIVRSKRSSDAYSMSSHSTSSSSYSEYEVWRLWEDCLDFQETLEEEYSKMSRQKVKVLRRGKKKEGEGPYLMHNAAASFDSLPEGPDPREVVVDVHDLIPQLTRKGTLFRVSRNTIKQRGDEFAAMIHALFSASEDAPVLLQELRNCTAVRDFFGFWRRDKDVEKKKGKDVGGLFHSNQSLSSIQSTAPSSPASSTFSAPPKSPGSSFRSSMFTRTKSRISDSVPEGTPSPPASAPPGTGRFAPNSLLASRSSTSLYHDRLSAEAYQPDNSIVFTDALLLEDDGAEHVQRRGSIRQPEAGPPLSPTRRVPDPIPEDDLPRPLPRARSSSCAVPEYRNGRIFVSTPSTLLPNPEEFISVQPHAYDRTIHPARRVASPPHENPNWRPTDSLAVIPSPTSSHSASPSSRASSISMTRFSITSSISSYVQSIAKRSSSGRDSRKSFDSDASVELDLPFSDSPVVLHTPLSEVAEFDVPESVDRVRDSFSSFASGRTDSSAEGVIPRYLRPISHRLKRSMSLDSREENRTPMVDHQAQSRIEAISEGGDDLIDSYFDDGKSTPDVSTENELPRFMQRRSKDSAGSTSSAGSFGEAHAAFAVKALYGDSIVVFRVERDMPFKSIRQRIQDKFALHESVPLDRGFILAYLPSRAAIMKDDVPKRRGRSNSAASAMTDMSYLRLLESEVDWQSVAATCGGKVTLIVLDAESA